MILPLRRIHRAVIRRIVLRRLAVAVLAVLVVRRGGMAGGAMVRRGAVDERLPFPVRHLRAALPQIMVLRFRVAWRRGRRILNCRAARLYGVEQRKRIESAA